jgi:hypothetical protein
MMKMKLALLGLALIATAPLSAQQQVVLAPSETQSVLRSGTPIVLRVMETITTKDKVAKINDRVRLEVAESVSVNGVTIIPSGSPATGELIDVKYKGMWGKSGRLVGRVLTVNANGRTIRLSGTFDTKGGSGTVGAVAVSAIVFAPAGFFMTGKSAELPAGTTVRGFVDEDISFVVASGPSSQPASQPMVIKQ